MKERVKVFKNDLSLDGYGDFVKCNNCGELQLIEIGGEQCKCCGKEGSLIWAEEHDFEFCPADLKDLGYEVEMV